MQDLEQEINDIMDTFSQEVKEAAEKIGKDVAKECASKLKETSPQKSGEYAKGWKVRTQGGKSTVYNASKWQLTHLLENGHVTKNQYGACGTGRTKAVKHIKPVETWGNEEYEKRVKEELSR